MKQGQLFKPERAKSLPKQRLDFDVGNLHAAEAILGDPAPYGRRRCDVFVGAGCSRKAKAAAWGDGMVGGVG